MLGNQKYEPTINFTVFPLRKQAQKELRCPRKFWFYLIKHIIYSSWHRRSSHWGGLFKHIKRLIHLLQTNKIEQQKNLSKRCCEKLKHTTPFAVAFLMRSRTRPITSQRAEKLTTAHLSTEQVWISFWKERERERIGKIIRKFLHNQEVINIWCKDVCWPYWWSSIVHYVGRYLHHCRLSATRYKIYLQIQ